MPEPICTQLLYAGSSERRLTTNALLVRNDIKVKKSSEISLSFVQMHVTNDHVMESLKTKSYRGAWRKAIAFTRVRDEGQLYDVCLRRCSNKFNQGVVLLSWKKLHILKRTAHDESKTAVGLSMRKNKSWKDRNVMEWNVEIKFNAMSHEIMTKMSWNYAHVTEKALNKRWTRLQCQKAIVQGESWRLPWC